MREHGISGITDERVEELRQLSGAMPEGLVFSLAGSLLSDAGSGEYDYETDTFTPSRNGVYSFDMEIWNTEKMYTDFLRGVSALGEGVLNVLNIFRPQAIILGGGISAEGETLLEPLRRYVYPRMYVSVEYAPVSLVCATLGNDAGLYGAAQFAFEKL